MSYWFILSAARALAKRGILHPLPASWIANVIIFSSSIFTIIRMRKNQ